MRCKIYMTPFFINTKRLCQLLLLDSEDSLQANRAMWINNALKQDKVYKDEKWTKNLAVGGYDFTKAFIGSLGMKGQNRVIQLVDDTCVVKEPSVAYSMLFDAKKTGLSG